MQRKIIIATTKSGRLHNRHQAEKVLIYHFPSKRKEVRHEVKTDEIFGAMCALNLVLQAAIQHILIERTVL